MSVALLLGAVMSVALLLGDFMSVARLSGPFCRGRFVLGRFVGSPVPRGFAAFKATRNFSIST